MRDRRSACGTSMIDCHDCPVLLFCVYGILVSRDIVFACEVYPCLAHSLYTLVQYRVTADSDAIVFKTKKHIVRIPYDILYRILYPYGF